MSNTTSICKKVLLIILLAMSSCASKKLIPTRDVCTVEKHFKDAIYQVKINGEKINNHWYIKEDAINIYKNLSKKNKCKVWIR